MEEVVTPSAVTSTVMFGPPRPTTLAFATSICGNAWFFPTKKFTNQDRWAHRALCALPLDIKLARRFSQRGRERSLEQLRLPSHGPPAAHSQATRHHSPLCPDEAHAALMIAVLLGEHEGRGQSVHTRGEMDVHRGRAATPLLPQAAQRLGNRREGNP